MRSEQLDIANCKLANVVALSDDKLGPVKGTVQTNIVAAVRPVHHR